MIHSSPLVCVLASYPVVSGLTLGDSKNFLEEIFPNISPCCWDFSTLCVGCAKKPERNAKMIFQVAKIILRNKNLERCH